MVGPGRGIWEVGGGGGFGSETGANPLLRIRLEHEPAPLQAIGCFGFKENAPFELGMTSWYGNVNGSDRDFDSLFDTIIIAHANCPTAAEMAPSVNISQRQEALRRAARCGSVVRAAGFCPSA